MGLESQLHKVPADLLLKYRENTRDINGFRMLGYELRKSVRQDPVRNGHLLTREMHPVEMEVVEYLCPGIKAKGGKERLKAWYWVLRQDWGKDLRASPYDKRYSGKSTNTA